MTNNKHRPQLNAELTAQGFVLHPNYIIRVCGEPADLVQHTTNGAVSEHLAAITARSNWIEGNKSDYCQIIEGKIPGLDDKTRSNQLLKLKRNIFNGRQVNPDLMKAVQDSFSRDEFAKVSKIAASVNQLLHDKQRLAEVYQQEMQTTSAHLAALWQRPNLQHALSYTNARLFMDVAGLYNNPNKKIKPKKRRQLEAGLLRYASRASLKTSPLSTFTPVFVGQWQAEGADNQIEFSGELDNRTEIKSGLIQAILDTLLTRYDTVKHAFPLRLNTSLQLVEQTLLLKQQTPGPSVNGRVWGSGENAVQFKLNQVIHCILVAFQRLQQPSATVAELIASVKAIAPKLDDAFIDKAISQLFSMQVFVAESGFYGQIELMDWAEQVLAQAGEHIPADALAALQALKEQLASFPTQAPTTRLQTGDAVNETVSALADALDAKPDPELASPAFFENSYLTQPDMTLAPSVMASYLDDIAILTELSPFFDVQQLAQTNAADFFLDRFGADGVCDKPVDFINDFAAIYGVGLPGFVPDAEKLSPRSDATNAFREAIGAFTRFLLDEVFSADDEVALDADKMRTFIDSLPESIRQRGVSHSFLGQVAGEGADQRFVINQVFSGQSGLLSRFLEVLDNDQLGDIRDYIRDISRDGDYAEISGLFGFNANKHPRMADKELHIPPFPGNWQDVETLDPSSMTLVYDKATHKVFFKQANGQLLDCFYHGFLMPLLLPNFHRILALLGMNGVLIYVLPILRSGRFSARDEIGFIPRVRLGNVVLIRQSFMVPREMLPDVNLSEVEFFTQMQAFIIEHKLPMRCFIRVSPFDTNPGSEESKLDWAALDFKNMKPFYMDFTNPRMVQLLYMSMSRNDYPIVLTEPSPDIQQQQVNVAGEPHVAELQFEITKKPLTVNKER